MQVLRHAVVLRHVHQWLMQGRQQQERTCSRADAAHNGSAAVAFQRWLEHTGQLGVSVANIDLVALQGQECTCDKMRTCNVEM